MSAKPYVAPDHLFLVKMTARSLRVGDIVKTWSGLREVLQISNEEGDVYFTFRDSRFVTGEYGCMEVLVQ
jgi:hypothetical protein